MAKELFRVTVKIEFPNGSEKWLKYRNVDEATFYRFLYTHWPDWRYVNLYHNDTKVYVRRVYNRRHDNDKRGY